MAKKQSALIEAAIKEMRQLLAMWLETSTKASKPVARMLRLIDLLEGHLRPEPAGKRHTRGKQGRRYSIENTATGQFLAEGKTGQKSSPFKISKGMYDLTAQVLVLSESPLLFEELMELVAAKGAVAPGEYQIRVALRFWMSSSPPLVNRHRKKYHAIDRKSFVSATQAAWESL